MMRRCLSGLAVVLLAACAPLHLPGLAKPAAAPATVSFTTVKSPVIFASIPSRGVQGPLLASGQNGSVQSWKTADGASMAFDDGVLVATRGLGFDLMAADAAATRAALAAGRAAQYERKQTYLDGENRVVAALLRCSLTPARPATIEIGGNKQRSRLSEESCAWNGKTITNRFWRAADGLMLQSEQWQGPQIGMITTQRLIR